MNIAEISKKVRRRETPFYDRLYRIAKSVRGFEVPYVPGLHDILYQERNSRINLWRTFWRVFYYQPLFRSRCQSCGKNLYIYNSGQGLPVIQGDLQIFFGDKVSIYDRVTLAALTIGEKPKLIVGDNTDMSTHMGILVGNEVSIGSDCMIGCAIISDNPGHNPEIKERHNKLKKEYIGKVKIGNHVWAAAESMIIGSVTVGDWAIIAARAIVTKDVPPFCIAAGNPAKIIKKLSISEEDANKLNP